MATCPVCFECHYGVKELKYIHNIPRSFVTVNAETAQQDAGYTILFVNTLQPVIKEHEATYVANSNPNCERGSPTMSVLQSPMS